MVRKRRKNILKRLLQLMAVLMFISCKSQETKSITHITLDEFKKEVIGKNTQLIDVRTPKEYKEGFIDNAININIYQKDQFIKEIQKFEKTKPIYVYCHKGGRSGKASKLLEELGFKTINDFTGGWKAWTKDQE